MNHPEIIAFYLPQYHPTPNNDKWWGKGFTEWTNVGKAKKLFPGHQQPKIPADLGYYDLRLPEIRQAQADLAKESGITGFCYYHYWFGNGRRELELPFNEVLKSGQPEFPFMLCWANESWHKKFWNAKGQGSSKEILVAQEYPGDEDIRNHFYTLLPAFKDPRYIKIEGKIAFMIYRPFDYEDVNQFIEKWQILAIKEGLPGFHFIAHTEKKLDKATLENYLTQGFSAVNTVRLMIARDNSLKPLSKLREKIRWRLKIPLITNYKRAIEWFKSDIDLLPEIYPTIIPNWDHTPRSGRRGFVITGSTPELFKRHAKEFIALIEKKRNPVLFLKSWNEWGEGNYMEPDLKYGKGYINALKDALAEQNIIKS